MVRKRAWPPLSHSCSVLISRLKVERSLSSRGLHWDIRSRVQISLVALMNSMKPPPRRNPIRALDGLSTLSTPAPGRRSPTSSGSTRSSGPSPRVPSSSEQGSRTCLIRCSRTRAVDRAASRTTAGAGRASRGLPGGCSSGEGTRARGAARGSTGAGRRGARVGIGPRGTTARGCSVWGGTVGRKGTRWASASRGTLGPRSSTAGAARRATLCRRTQPARRRSRRGCWPRRVRAGCTAQSSRGTRSSAARARPASAAARSAASSSAAARACTPRASSCAAVLGAVVGGPTRARAAAGEGATVIACDDGAGSWMASGAERGSR